MLMEQSTSPGAEQEDIKAANDLVKKVTYGNCSVETLTHAILEHHKSFTAEWLVISLTAIFCRPPPSRGESAAGCMNHLRPPTRQL